MKVTDIIKDHSLKERLHARQAGADQFWSNCPWCKGTACLMLDPHKNEAWCTNKKCPAYMRKLKGRELDDALRHTRF